MRLARVPHSRSTLQLFRRQWQTAGSTIWLRPGLSSLRRELPWSLSIINQSTARSVVHATTLNAKADIQKGFQRKRGRVWKVLLFVIADLVAFEFILDHFLLDNVIERSLRAYSTLALVSLDYKLHAGSNAWLRRDDTTAIHQRNARRVCDMLKRNGGLYVKAGQEMAVQDDILPTGYQGMFNELFDSSPQNPWVDVEDVFREDFGCTIEEIFGSTVEKAARASASIAQVHYAMLADGREVAIKVQKKQIKNQLSWDLWTLK